MNSKFFRVAIVSLLFLAASCAKDDVVSQGSQEQGYNTRVDFDVTIDAVDMQVDVTPITTRSAEQNISDLWYVLFDDKGAPVPSQEGEVVRYVDYAHTASLGEMLPVGNYTAVFLGFSHGVSPDKQVEAIAALGDRWLTTTPTALAEGIYYYHRSQLKVVKKEANNFNVPLKPVVGQFVLDLTMASGQSQMVKQVEVRFAAPIYTALKADGTYGEPTASNFATVLDANRKFYSLPTVGKTASGSVKISLETVGGKIVERVYPFTNLRMEAGKVTRLNLTLDLDYNNLGVINVDRDFSDATFQMTMLQDGEDPHLYGIYQVGGETDTRRSFMANAPLRVNIRDNRDLELQFYSFQGISDVNVYMDIPGIEPFKVCHLDYMPPLKEARFPLALMSTEASYETITGKIVKLPAMSNLKNENAKFIIKSTDPYFVNKIEPLKCRWVCCFRNAGPDGVPMMEMNPRLARQGLAVMLNMACMFSTAEFEQSLYARQGKLYWTTVTDVVDTKDFYRKLLRIERLGMGLLQGGGSSYGILALSYYITGLQIYFEVPYTSTEVFLWFHEFSHILGSVDTGGNLNGFYDKNDKNKWVTFTSDIYVKMAAQKELPVYDQSMIDVKQ